MPIVPRITGSKVLESRETDDGTTIRRRRVTESGQRFTTYERVEQPHLVVRKSNGNRELFDREKLITSVRRSVGKFIGSDLEVEEVVGKVVALLRSENEEEVTSQQVGDAVLDVLAKTNEVAYVRFASVYREFKDINTFMDELKKILDK